MRRREFNGSVSSLRTTQGVTEIDRAHERLLALVEQEQDVVVCLPQQHGPFGRSPVQLIDNRVCVRGGPANDAPRSFTRDVVQRSFNLVPCWLSRARVLE